MGDQEGTTSVPDPVCGLTLWLEEVINGDHQVELELIQVLISRVSLTLVTRTHTDTHTVHPAGGHNIIIAAPPY